MPARSPQPRRSTAFLLVYALAYAGGVIGYLPLLSLLLPLRVEAVAGDARLGVLTATVIAGALSASAANILFGWLSDRSGTRRGWIAGGLVLLGASYAGVALAASPIALVLSVVAFQAAVNALLAPLMALMAEEIPDAQKGIAGGLLAFGNPLASALSAVLIGWASLGEAGRLALVPLAAALCVVPLLLTRAQPIEIPADVPPAVLRRDLALAWAARLLVQVAGNILSLYLLYYFESIAAEPPRQLAARVGHLLTVAYLLPLPLAVLAGRLSDRTGRRKPFLFGAASLAALGLAGMASAPDWRSGAAAFALYAIGASVFLALQAAFAMQLLPDPRHRGRDLGLLNLANTLPALLGPLLAWQLATPHDFAPLMLVLAALTLGGGVLILVARGRR